MKPGATHIAASERRCNLKALHDGHVQALNARKAHALAWISARTAEEGDCLLWTQPVNGEGYACASVGGRRVVIRRWVYEHLVGPIKPGFVITPSCGNKLCCAPAHLKAETRSTVNARTYKTTRNTETEYQRRKRLAISMGWSKLSMDDAIAIRRDSRTAREVAEAYRLHISTVYLIRQGKTWRESANGASVFTWRPAA